MFVPTELLPPILDDLARGKPPHPPRPWLGVLAQDFGPHVVVIGRQPARPRAARGAPAAATSSSRLADQPVSDLADFYTRLWAQGPAGATIALRIQRDADVFDVEIRSADRAALLKKPRFN
jgi:S1-C subfamily serine protease